MLDELGKLTNAAIGHAPGRDARTPLSARRPHCRHWDSRSPATGRGPEAEFPLPLEASHRTPLGENYYPPDIAKTLSVPKTPSTLSDQVICCVNRLRSPAHIGRTSRRSYRWASPLDAAPKIRRTTTAITTRSAIIWTMVTMRAISVFGTMSPNPTVEKIVTAKYRDSVRLSG
jgi:hypothetical protein